MINWNYFCLEHFISPYKGTFPKYIKYIFQVYFLLEEGNLFFFFLIVVQLLSSVWLFAPPWTAAHQASLSFTISQSLLKLTSVELVMPSHHLILLTPSPSALNMSQNQGLVHWVSSCVRWPKYWSFSIRPSNEYSELISSRIDWCDLLILKWIFRWKCFNL